MSTVAAPLETDALITRLHRIGGQVRGIEKMVVERRPCIDVLTQIAAASTALEALALAILDEHTLQCFTTAARSDGETLTEARARDVLDAIRRFARTR